MGSIQRAELIAHPSTPDHAVRGVGVDVGVVHRDTLEVQYSLDADMSRVRLPASGAGRRTDGLWRHTCFEAFVAFIDTPGYYEFNFSPSLDWAVYRFYAYRDGMSAIDLGRAPTISVRRHESGIDLRAAVRLEQLPGSNGHGLRIGLAAVIEDAAEGLSYWAVRHAPGKPDFHHPDGFALEVDRT
jgi:hypothetical protein